MHLKAGLIDLDGTLAELEIEHLIGEVTRFAISLGLQEPKTAQIQKCLAAGSLKDVIDAKTYPGFEEQFWDNYDESTVPPLKLLPATKQALASFVENGIKLALVTARNVHQDQAITALQLAGIDHYFAAVFTKKYSPERWEGKHKPFLEALTRLNISPSKAFAVGDRPSDAESSNKIGIALNILVRSGGTREDLLLGAPCHRVMNDIGETAQLVRDFRSQHFVL